MSAARTQAGRLAIRQIRDEVRAYYAMPDTMKGALLLATMKTAFFRDDREMFDRWIDLMRDAVTKILADQGAKAIWPEPPQRAPEHERGKEPWSGDA